MIIFFRILPLVFFLFLVLINFGPTLRPFVQKTDLIFYTKTLIRPVISLQNELIVSLVEDPSDLVSSASVNWSKKTDEQCVKCHFGIEAISDSHPPEIGCVVCHGGNANLLTKNEAHLNLIFDSVWGVGRKNPSHLKLADQSCGQSGCHSSSYFLDQKRQVKFITEI